VGGNSAIPAFINKIGFTAAFGEVGCCLSLLAMTMEEGGEEEGLQSGQNPPIYRAFRDKRCTARERSSSIDRPEYLLGGGLLRCSVSLW